LQTVSEIYNAKTEIKRSTFLSYLLPIAKFEEFHEILRSDHPKAAHIVWAYRKLNKYSQIIEAQSDDGEPKGTSGQPCLNALRGAGLIDAAVLVVRYFGGIKLGTGGLVRAYGGAANLAINEANLENFEQKDICGFFVPFSLTARFEHFLQKKNLEAKREFNEDGAIWQVEFNEDEFNAFYDFAHHFEAQNFAFLAIPLFAKRIF